MDRIQETAAPFCERRIACLRCHLEVALSGDEETLRLAYDFERWQAGCCCCHLDSPASCCSFLQLEAMINARRPH